MTTDDKPEEEIAVGGVVLKLATRSAEQIVGTDLPSDDEQLRLLTDLATIKAINPVTYARKRKDLARLLQCRVADIDDAVKLILDERGSKSAEVEDVDKLDAIYALQGMARHKADIRSPRVRLIWYRDALWLDLGRVDWKGVRITSKGWEIVDQILAPLIRGQGMDKLPLPRPGGNITDLRSFANVHDDEEFALFCGAAIGLLNPFGDYTTTVLSGPAGSGKTTATLVLRGLVDPRRTGSIPLTDKRNMMFAAKNSHILAFENVSEISATQSDAICTLNTGTGHSERRYHTNDGKLNEWHLHCPVLINGIPGNLAQREDLADRCVAFDFPLLHDRVISKDKFWRGFEAKLPYLLGALLDGVVAALRVREQFSGDNDAAAKTLLGDFRPRFVDFAVWAEAGCRAMGLPDGAFSRAYRDNLGAALRYLADRDPAVVGIRKLMITQRLRKEWRGHADELYRLILPLTIGMDKKLSANASWFSRSDLPHAIPLLAKVHQIFVETKQKLHGNDNKNGIIIRVGKGTHFSPDPTDTLADPPEPEPGEGNKMGTLEYPPEKPKITRRF
jgi:hypothetical protein